MKCSTLVLSSLSPLPPSTKNQSPCLGNTLPQSQSHFNHQTVSFSAPVLGFEYLQPICQSQTHFSFKREIILPPFLSIFLQLTFAVYHELLPFISSKILSDLGKWFASTLLGRYNWMHHYLVAPYIVFPANGQIHSNFKMDTEFKILATSISVVKK